VLRGAPGKETENEGGLWFKEGKKTKKKKKKNEIKKIKKGPPHQKTHSSRGAKPRAKT